MGRGLASLAVAAGLVLLVGGCGQQKIEVTHGPLSIVQNPVSLSIQADELAANTRKEPPDRIGAVLFTVGGIPTSFKVVETPLPETIHPFVVEAMERAGYSVVDVRGKKPANMPVLRGELKDFWFAIYTWGWPLLVQAGKVEYHLFLQRPDGTIVWEKTFKSDAGGTVLSPDWNGMMNKALTKILNQIIAEVQTEEFKAALGK